MKILVFSEYYYPERFLINEITEELAAKGHEVTVITGKPNYNFPGGKIPKEYKKVSFEKINGVDVHRCSVLGRGKNKIRLFLNYLSYAKNAYGIAKKLDEEYDIVYCYQLTPVSQLKPAIKYAARHKKKLVCYCLDLAPLSGERLLKRFKPAEAIYRKKSKEYYRACDKILVTSKSFIDYLVEVNGVDREKIEYLPQHAPDFYCGESEEKNGQITRFMFAGNLGKAAKLENVISAADKIRKNGIENFSVIFVGEGADKENLVALTQKFGLSDCVKFAGGVPMDEMKNKYLEADALLVTLRKGQITIPGKLQAYMSTGRPIIGAMDGSGKDLIAESNCGLCSAAEDDSALADIMQAFINRKSEFIECGKNGRKYYSDNFTLDHHIKRLETVFDELCDFRN